MLTSLVVLCDGFQSSIKAVMFAGFPGMLLRGHEGTELVLVHVCGNKEALLRNNDAATNVGGGAHLHSGVASSAVLNSDEVVRRALLMCTQGSSDGSFMDLTNFNNGEEQNMNKPQVSLPSFLVIHNTLTAIQKNKMLAGKLNYKMVTSLLSGLGVSSSVATGEDAEGKYEDAAAVATYAAAHAQQYNTNTILLGAGNVSEGKLLRVGAVAKQVLKLKKDFCLYFIKANGFTLRASTARVFYMVIIPVMAQDDDSGGNAEEQLQAGVDAVNYALQRRRAQSDAAPQEAPQHFNDIIAVTLVVEPSAGPSRVAQYTQTFESILNKEQPQKAEPENDAKEQDVRDANNNVEVDAGNYSKEEVKTTVSNEALPLVSICTLKPTKANPQPTVRSAATQVSKFVSSFKPSFLVTSNTAPDELHLCLLKEPKYHCIIVSRHK